MWFYQYLLMFKEKKPFRNPDKPKKQWNAEQNRQWLGVRGLDKTGNAKELRERVKNYCEDKDGEPPVIDNVVRVDDIQKLIISWYNVLKVVMKEEIKCNDIQQADVNIRIFLTIFASIDKKFVKKKKSQNGLHHTIFYTC